jgi:soluble lytic murein transglycosylase
LRGEGLPVLNKVTTARRGRQVRLAIALAACCGSALAATRRKPSPAAPARTHPPSHRVSAAKHKGNARIASASRREKSLVERHGVHEVHVKGHADTRAEAITKAATTMQTVRLNGAFAATATLRPMAQQLASGRSAAAFAGVLNYAQTHPGMQAATAYLALGHAYALDHRYDDAANAFRQASSPGEALGDYADYLGAQALISGGHPEAVGPLLDGFARRFPDSIFVVNAPLLQANADLLTKNGIAAVQALLPLQATPEAEHSDFRYLLARSYQASGDTARAIALYRDIFNRQPLSNEAVQAQTQLQALGQQPSAAERKLRADALFNAKRYSEADNEYNQIRNDSSLTTADRDGLEIYSAVCALRLKHLSRKDVDKLPATNDDTAALKLYLYAEISRSEKDRTGHDALIAQMVDKYPQSRWTEEALYSGGNMYLLTHDMQQAIYHYKLLVEHFPNSIYAPSAHWRYAWMEYRLRHYPQAAQLFDEQVVRYGQGIEASSALYWRGRIYEDEGHDFPQAANYYRSLTVNYPSFYYGDLARARLAVLGAQPAAAPTAALGAVRPAPDPNLSDAVPQDDPHVIKARLLANAALNEYIGPEIAASPGAGEWGALAQAQIYSSFGEVTRAIVSLKHSGISFFAMPRQDVPTSYWKMMFPQPYWSDLVADSERNGLDPYLVASLIRQESEFNAGAISPAHAIGLMQLEPSTGKLNAKKEGIKGFNAGMLLNPAVNLELGTRNLRAVLDRFGGQPEYALAAYNAGDVPVRQWMASGEFKDMPEFVESIPYTETREYVQAILRNRELYRMLYGGK